MVKTTEDHSSFNQMESSVEVRKGKVTSSEEKENSVEGTFAILLLEAVSHFLQHTAVIEKSVKRDHFGPEEVGWRFLPELMKVFRLPICRIYSSNQEVRLSWERLSLGLDCRSSIDSESREKHSLPV